METLSNLYFAGFMANLAIIARKRHIWSRHVTPPTRHRVSSEGSFFFPLINFKLVHSYNVKHLTCIILCSSGLQNIYTSSIYGNV